MVEWILELNFVCQATIIAIFIDAILVFYCYKKYKQEIADEKFSELEALVGKMR